MEKRAEIILKGRVQKAGFRDYIDEVAFNLNLRGWVKNLDDGTVKVVCEGSSKDIEKFVDKIKIHEYPIRVEDAKVEYLPSTDEFNDFTIIREDDIVYATYERMDAAGRYMREMNQNLGGKLDIMIDKQDSTLAKQDSMLEKTDSMLVKQDSMLEKQDNMLVKTDGMLKKQDGMLQKQDALQTTVENGFLGVKEEIRLQRDDFRELFMHEVTELRSEITEIKATLAKMQAA